MDTTQIPLSHRPSLSPPDKQTATTLPPEVVQCLENARFLHLATCSARGIPHVSLMNYTYLPGNPFDRRVPVVRQTQQTQQQQLRDARGTQASRREGGPAADAGGGGPVIIMTTNQESRKTLDIEENPNVSLLVHDWSSHRPLSARRPSASSSLPQANAATSPLATLLLNLNSYEAAGISGGGSISCTIGGLAELVPAGSEEERWFLARHLENHTFDSGHHAVGGSSGGPETEQQHQQRNGQRSEADGDRRETAAATGFAGFASDVEAVRVIVVRITDVRISDWKGGVRDWELGSPDGTAGAGDAPLVNGTR